MLFETPALDERDLAVLDAIEQYRSRLRFHLSKSRRWKGQLRRNLRARAMRGSNSIEGYEVSLDDAIALLEDDEQALDADQRTILEVTGYRNAMTYIQELADDDHFNFDQSLVRGLHFILLGHDLTKSPGRYRKADIYVLDEDEDEIVYEGPDSDDVPALMAELVQWMEHADNEADDAPVLVTAAMAHLNLVMIHPFRDGNGRMARCLQTMILTRNQILSQEFSSIEEWLGKNTQAYYDVLAKTGNGTWSPERDASEWVKFNLRAHHMQAQTVQQRVLLAEALWSRLATLVESLGLHERTISGLYTASLGLRVRRTTYEQDAEVEAGTAGRDLKALVSADLLKPQGETRGRYYLRTDTLRDLFTEVRNESRRKLVEPYEADLEALAPEPRRTRLGSAIAS